MSVDESQVILELKKWYIEYKNADGITRRVAGYADKQATAQMAAELERQAAHQQTGLVDRFAQHRKRPLSEHIDDWRASLIAKGNTTKHADLLKSRMEKAIEECGFRYWRDIMASRVQTFIGDRRTSGTSLQTCNFYLQAVKQFCRGMVRDGRAADGPVAYLSGHNVTTDRRHDRRALSAQERRALLSTTELSTTRYGMSGPERAMLYRVVTETGLRTSEARSLLPG